MIDSVQTPGGAIHYADNFYVYTSDAGSPNLKVSLIRLGAATHSFDQNQRFVPLEFIGEPQNGRLNVAAPAQANLAPPGYYMLFLCKFARTNANGMQVYYPSVAKIVKVAPVESLP